VDCRTFFSNLFEEKSNLSQYRILRRKRTNLKNLNSIKSCFMKVFSLATVLVIFIVGDIKAQNVGIGTQNPLFPLDVRNTSTGTVLGLRTMKDSIGATTLIRFTTAFNNFAIPDDKSSFMGNTRSGSGSNLVFGTASNGEPAEEKMRLNYAGNLGLGTITPVSKLHIDLSESANSNAIYIDNNNQSSLISFRQDGILQGFIQSVEDDLRISTNGGNANGILYLGANGINRVAINGEGNVGIRTSLPAAPLHVFTGDDAAANTNGFLQLGATTSTNLVLDNNEILARNNGVVSTLFVGRDGSMVQIGNSTATPGTKLYVTSGGNLDLTEANSGFMVLGSTTGTNLAFDNNEIQARTNGVASTLFFQHKGGNVRIGDGDFSSGLKLGVTGDAIVTGNLRVGTQPLPAGYSFGVDGKMVCTEVLVRLTGNWPDYVFDPGYKLRNLDDLGNFIKTNKHLPGIPKSSEVEKGLSLGEMQKLQMEKIEELTLYILQLKKELDELRATQK
jgi:hypothetical protein